LGRKKGEEKRFAHAQRKSFIFQDTKKFLLGKWNKTHGEVKNMF
jgi:hypothetical protein